MGKAAAVLVSTNKAIVPKRLTESALNTFSPLTPAQELMWKEYADGKNLLLHGVAGTGKTFISCYLAMKEILSRNSPYKKLVVVRSAVATRDLGALPGTLEEKESVYMRPYEAIFKEVFIPNGQPIMEKIAEHRLFEFMSTSYLRGLTFHNAIVIVDEMQNLNYHELCTVMTRLGDDCKIIFSGDFRQTDLLKPAEKEGLDKFIKILRNMGSFSMVNFKVEDIVRSGLVKEFITTQVRLGLA